MKVLKECGETVGYRLSSREMANVFEGLEIIRERLERFFEGEDMTHIYKAMEKTESLSDFFGSIWNYE